jgi:hypothetical protein
MPRCTVHYHVTLVPRIPHARPVNVIGVFCEERAPDEVGEPGPLISRWLDTFSGAAGSSITAMVMQSDAWHVDLQERIGPLEWDG